MIRFTAAVAALFLGMTLILGGPREAEAKGPSWIITGGALGEQAVLVGFWDFEADVENPPGSDAVLVAAPLDVPPGGYEFYRYLGIGRVAEDVRKHDAEFRFYPEAGLLHDRRDYAGEHGQWYQVADHGAVRQFVAFAVSRLGTEDAQPNPILAAAKASGYLTRGSTSFRIVRPRWRDQAVHGTLGSLIDDEALDFARAIVEMVSNPPDGQGFAPESWWVMLSTHGAIGFYAPPDAAQGVPGRFWSGYSVADLEADTDYFATSPQFDALVQRSIEIGEVHELAEQRAAEEQRERIRLANNERMARVAGEARASYLLEFRAAEPPILQTRALEGAARAGVQTLLAAVAAALALAAGLGVVFRGRLRLR